jgi:porphobilinogen synthase
MIRETDLCPEDLIMPLFIVDGQNRCEHVASLPGIERLSIDLVLREVEWLHARGVQGVLLFPVIPPERKTAGAEEAWNEEGLLPSAVRAIKAALPQVTIFTDVALDPYTPHGHDGLVDTQGEVLNDETVECLVSMALAHARAGVDFVAPSDMMDGRIGAIRTALDQEGFTQTGILAYSAKYASSLYAPFRDALHSQLAFGTKKGYQMDPANRREALLEAAMDEKEGADLLLVKPATFYLDVIARLRAETLRPIVAYHVSGEYAMILAAHAQGWIDAQQVLYEALLSIKRAGADLVISYGTKRILPSLNRFLSRS